MHSIPACYRVHLLTLAAENPHRSGGRRRQKNVHLSGGRVAISILCQPVRSSPYAVFYDEHRTRRHSTNDTGSDSRKSKRLWWFAVGLGVVVGRYAPDRRRGRAPGRVRHIRKRPVSPNAVALLPWWRQCSTTSVQPYLRPEHGVDIPGRDHPSPDAYRASWPWGLHAKRSHDGADSIGSIVLLAACFARHP